MGENLTDNDKRIWDLHDQGFCTTRIAGLVGRGEGYVRSVIVGAWLDDKLRAKGSGKS